MGCVIDNRGKERENTAKMTIEYDPKGGKLTGILAVFAEKFGERQVAGTGSGNEAIPRIVLSDADVVARLSREVTLRRYEEVKKNGE